MHTRWITWCSTALLAGVAATAQAQDPNVVRALAATCFTCHGTDGRSVGSVPPTIAGQSKTMLLQSMRDFRDGKRPATIMHQLAKGYTDEQLDAIAGYFANVKAAPAKPSGGSAAPAGTGY